MSASTVAKQTSASSKGNGAAAANKALNTVSNASRVGGAIGGALAGPMGKAAGNIVGNIVGKAVASKPPVKKAKGGMIKKYSKAAKPQRFSGTY